MVEILLNLLKYLYLLIYLSRYLDQETAKGRFWFSSSAAICYLPINLTTQS